MSATHNDYWNRQTTQVEWSREDAYHNAILHSADPILDNAVRTSKEGGLPEIAVSKAQGKFLTLLATSIGAKRILELGTLGGYSAICLARALPDDGEMVTCELREKHAEVAAKNIAAAGLSSKVHIKLGPALETISKLPSNEPFDLVFMDADSIGLPKYFPEAKRLLRKGGAIIIDNMVRYGLTSDPAVQNNPETDAVRALLKVVQEDKEVQATTICTVGDKGFDGFLYAVKM